jgi:hypothetical protein
MNPLELFKYLEKNKLTFSKPLNEKEILFMAKQRESLNSLIACDIIEKNGRYFSLNNEGKRASIIGIKKWAKDLEDIKKRELVYNVFGFFNNWYNLPRLKIMLEKITKSKISNELWNVIKAVLILLIVWFIKEIFGIKLN